MARVNQQRWQYTLASLFWLMLLVALLAGAWRIGWMKVAATVAIGTGVLFCLVWAAFLFDELRR
ncbi:MAG TPA: hypothetical protein VFB80_24530 [Pirellulaceae bacterium]|nr:hypothetical protein [Pirellulaceae bacterium]